MDDKPCLGQFKQHSWGMWVGYDPLWIENFSAGWSYRRECTLTGCPAKEFVKELVADGKTVVSADGTFDPTSKGA